MADYNIYIHSLGGQQNSVGASFTTPWKQGSEDDGYDDERDTSREDTDKLEPSALSEMGNKVAVAYMKGGWVGAAIAIAVTGAKIYKQVYKLRVDFGAMQSGDFRGSIGYQNYETMKNNILHPISWLVNAQKFSVQNRLQNERNKLHRELLGDSEINRYADKGY